MYFKKFPKITYANTNAIDITSRVILTDNTLKNPYLFYPYTIVEYERADQFSERYYRDAYFSWLLYLSNNIIDPYYEWYLTVEQFNDFIQTKYGSIENAQRKVKHYINNWENDLGLTIEAYNALPPTLIHYWEPKYHPTTHETLSYTRKKDENILNTNNIRGYTVSNNSFIIDEICTVNFDGTNIGKGQVSVVVGNTVYLQHTSGTTLNTPEVLITGSSYIYGSESTVNTVFTSSTPTANNLLSEEESYWIPVTYYDWENTKNEYNKTIRVLDSEYAKRTSKIVTGLLSNV